MTAIPATNTTANNQLIIINIPRSLQSIGLDLW
jgi:hypothetical protein